MEEIIHRMQHGNDQAAFRDFYRLYAPRLLSFAYSFIKCKAGAEEVVNDTFLNCWKHRGKLHEIGNMQVYLYVSVKNRAVNYLSRQVKAGRQLLDITAIPDIQLQFSPDPEQLMITRDLHRKVTAAIATLPPRCRLIFKLIKEDGLKYREVAEILEISAKTVENQINIAIHKITQEVKLNVDAPVAALLPKDSLL